MRRVSSNRSVFLVAGVAFLAALLVHLPALYRPLLLQDDFEILRASWTWDATRENLWVPAQEHIMPPGRLTTWLVVHGAGRMTNLPLLAALHGFGALWAGMTLVYLFLRRELCHSFYGVLGMVLFGVTTVYHQAVVWYAASFGLLALDTTLLALLTAQSWRRRGGTWRLFACAGWSALASAWFGSGILAGPFCVLYLYAASPEQAGVGWPRRYLSPLLPLLGTAGFLAVALPRSVAHIARLGHFEGRPLWEAFHLPVALGYTARALVDSLALGVFGISGVTCPVWLLPVPLLLLGVVAVWWWRRSPFRPLATLGLGMILGSYLLIYSARSEWDYDAILFYMPNWGRYHLFAHLGLTLFVCAGLPAWRGRWFVLDENGGLTRGQVRDFVRLAGVLFLIHFPRANCCHALDYDHGQQWCALRRLEETDARCEFHHIDAATARAALGNLDLSFSFSSVNGWDFLRGSSEPRPHTIDEARRLLEAPVAGSN
jgi:hypothetical protein